MRVLYGSDSAGHGDADDVRARTPQGGPDYKRYASSPPCDAANHFSFNGLPDGGLVRDHRDHARGRRRAGGGDAPDRDARLAARDLALT